MTKRADQTALLVRKRALEGELAELRERSLALEPLEAKAAECRKELRDVNSLLASTTKKRSLPMLDSLRIATPCEKQWSEMKGDDHVRFCDSCEKNVYDLSSLTREQAEALLQQKEGDLCVTFFQRKDGTVLTSDCPVGVKKRRHRNAAAAIVAGIGSAVAAVAGALNQPELPPPVMSLPHVEFPPERPVVIAPMAPPGRRMGGVAPIRTMGKLSCPAGDPLCTDIY